MSAAMILEPSARPRKVEVVPGRTYVAHHEDKLVWAEVHKTPADALKHVQQELEWQEKQAARSQAVLDQIKASDTYNGPYPSRAAAIDGLTQSIARTKAWTFAVI